MTLGARFTKWGLGLFIFGVFLVFGIIGHYCGGARWPTGEQFLWKITLWYACPWTLSVAAVQAGGARLGGLGLGPNKTARLFSNGSQNGRGTQGPCRWVRGVSGVFA